MQNFVSVDISKFGWRYAQFKDKQLSVDEFNSLTVHRSEYDCKSPLHECFNFGKYQMVFVHKSTRALEDSDREFIPEDLQDIVDRKYSFFTALNFEIQLPDRDTPSDLWDYVRKHPKILAHEPPLDRNLEKYLENIVQTKNTIQKILNYKQE